MRFFVDKWFVHGRNGHSSKLSLIITSIATIFSLSFYHMRFLLMAFLFASLHSTLADRDKESYANREQEMIKIVA